MEDKYRLITSKDRKAEYLDQTKWGNQQSYQELLDICMYMEYFEVPASYRLFDEGETNNDFLVLVKGTIEITKRNSLNQQILLARFKKGDFFGEMSLFDGQPRSARATTLTPCGLLALSASKLEQMERNSCETAVLLLKKLLFGLSQRLRLTTSKYVE
jgi:CRP-like cAMP-binding protein